MENKLAPVIIPTLNRFEHLKNCIESLARCTLADKTDLVIGLDYPKNEAHLSGYKLICNYLDRGVKGFNSVRIFKRNSNFGPRKNIQSLREYVFKEFDKVICTEDDNIFSPNFLIYVNKGLNKYKNNKDVFAICGYNFPINLKNYSYNNYAANVFCAWGYGIWKDRVELLENNRNISYLKSVLRSKKVLKSYIRYGSLSTYCSFFRMINEEIPLYGDALISSILIKNSMIQSLQL